MKQDRKRKSAVEWMAWGFLAAIPAVTLAFAVNSGAGNQHLSTPAPATYGEFMYPSNAVGINAVAVVPGALGR